MRKYLRRLFIAIVAFGGVNAQAEPAEAASPAIVSSEFDEMRDVLKSLLKGGTDLSTQELRQTWIYRPFLDKMPPAFRDVTKRYFDLNDQIIGEVIKSGNYDIGDRLFDAWRDSKELSNMLNDPTLNINEYNQAELARRKMCEHFPDSCGARRVQEIDPASLNLADVSYICKPQGIANERVAVNPNVQFVNECGLNGRSTGTSQWRNAGFIIVSCRGWDKYRIQKAYSGIPDSRKERDGDKVGYSGYSYATPCRPSAGADISGGLRNLLFGR